MYIYTIKNLANGKINVGQTIESDAKILISQSAHNRESPSRGEL
jgi:hypothetical protein